MGGKLAALSASCALQRWPHVTAAGMHALPPRCVCCSAPRACMYVLAAHAPCMGISPIEELNIGEGKPTRMTLVGLMSDLVPHALPCVMVPCVMGGADWAGRVIS